MLCSLERTGTSRCICLTCFIILIAGAFTSCRVLHMENNCLRSLQGLSALTQLRTLSLNSNALRTLLVPSAIQTAASAPAESCTAPTDTVAAAVPSLVVGAPLVTAAEAEAAAAKVAVTAAVACQDIGALSGGVCVAMRPCMVAGLPPALEELNISSNPLINLDGLPVALQTLRAASCGG